MNTVLRKTAIKKIIENLEALDASEFEYLCHNLVCTLENQQLIHRGLNLDGKPVGYTVDTFDSQRTIVAEYGTESGYFTFPFTKLASDTKHACEKAKSLEKLYLFGNSKCQNSNWEKTKDLARDTAICGYKDQKRQNLTIEVFDSPRIALAIYDAVLEKNNLYEYFSNFIPSLESIWQDFQFAYNIPPIPLDYVSASEHEKELESSLQKHNIVVVSGISGIGKSYTVTEYTNQHKDSFDNVIWLHGDDIPHQGSFCNLLVNRLGVSFNLSGKFNSTKTLLVIDSWEENLSKSNFQELEAGFLIGSKVIVTSQRKPSEDIISLLFNKTETSCAYSILTFDIPIEEKNPIAIDAIIKNSGGHPLLMALIRGIVADGDASWNELANDASSWPQIEDNREKTILERILDTHSEKISRELSILRWLDTKNLDATFVKHIFGIAGFRKLKHRSLLQEQSHGMLKLHDLTNLCIQSTCTTNDSGNEIEKRFLDFFLARLDAADFHFQRSLHTCKNKIINLVENSKVLPDLIHYLYFLLDAVEINHEILTEVAEIKINDNLNSAIAIHAILESREKLIFNSRREGTETPHYDALTIDEISISLKSFKLKNKLSHVLLHHQGKSLRRIGKITESLSAFEGALKFEPNAHHTRLQIARFCGRSDRKKAERYLEQIITDYIQDPETVAITVLLSAIVEVCRLRGGYEIFLEKIENFRNIIIEIVSLAQAEGFSQPYEVISSLGRNVYYKDPDLVLELFKNSNLPDTNLDYTKIKHFDVAECLKNVGKAALQKENPQQDPLQLFNLAIQYYNKVETNNQFQLTMMAEGALLANKADLAISFLKCIPSDKWNCHIHHRMAQSLEALKRFSEAITEIGTSISSCEDEKYLSAFHDRKAEILYKLGEKTAAISSWEDAIKYCNSDKFIATLEGKLKLIQ